MIKLLKDNYESVNKTLTQVKDMNFSEIIIVGFKDGNSHTISSGMASKSKSIGALQIAIMNIYNDNIQ